VASAISAAVAALPERSFVRRSDFDAPRGPVHTALSRLCTAEALVRVRKGLYWKGSPTRFGMSRPAVDDIALEVGGPGSGPAGIAAAHWLGLTTQVPATFVVAVPTRAPKGWQSVEFSQRSLSRRLREMSPTEVALIEVLRSGPAVVEHPWESIASTVGGLVESGTIRPKLITQQIGDEPHRETRQRWHNLVTAHAELATVFVA